MTSLGKTSSVEEPGADSALPTYFSKGQTGLMMLSLGEFQLRVQIGKSSRNTEMKVAFLGRCFPQ